MGDCCCKEKEDDEPNYVPTTTPALSAMILESHLRIPKVEDPKVIDQLILEMLTVAASRVDT